MIRTCLLMSSIAQLKKETETRPKMLLNRLHLTITGETTHDDFSNLLADLHTVYTSKITGMHLVLPTRSDPPELVRCTAMVRGAASSAAAEPSKWSGAIRVVSRKRGLLIKLEVEKGATRVAA